MNDNDPLIDHIFDIRWQINTINNNTDLNITMNSSTVAYTNIKITAILLIINRNNISY
jgi:hypothetical protein